jgi:hypothetical protein
VRIIIFMSFKQGIQFYHELFRRTTNKLGTVMFTT